MSRRANGEGSVSKRKDGRYEASVWVLAAGGGRKRLRFYVANAKDGRARIRAALASSERGIPAPDRNWTVADYLDRWLADTVAPTRRQQTYELYERTVRLHLKPLLGRRSLVTLSVPTLQAAFNQELVAGKTVRTVHLEREVLSSAIGRAMREELVSRNVARLVELPGRVRHMVVPWSAAEAATFLEATTEDHFHLAYLLLLTYGLRRGEVLGLRWSDVVRVRPHMLFGVRPDV